MEKTLKRIASRIERIKKELMEIGEMRPGSLTKQNRGPKKAGAYYQLSYTHRMKGHTEYVRKEFVTPLKNQIATYKRFKKCVDEWIRLAIQHSKIQMDSAKRKDSG
jgi:hypothetical protein